MSIDKEYVLKKYPGAQVLQISNGQTAICLERFALGNLRFIGLADNEQESWAVAASLLRQSDEFDKAHDKDNVREWAERDKERIITTWSALIAAIDELPAGWTIRLEVDYNGLIFVLLDFEYKKHNVPHGIGDDYASLIQAMVRYAKEQEPHAKTGAQLRQDQEDYDDFGL